MQLNNSQKNYYRNQLYGLLGIDGKVRRLTSDGNDRWIFGKYGSSETAKTFLRSVLEREKLGWVEILHPSSANRHEDRWSGLWEGDYIGYVCFRWPPWGSKLFEPPTPYRLGQIKREYDLKLHFEMHPEKRRQAFDEAVRRHQERERSKWLRNEKKQLRTARRIMAALQKWSKDGDVAQLKSHVEESRQQETSSK